MASNLTKTTKSVKKFLIYFAIFVIIIIVADYFTKSYVPITPPSNGIINSNYPQPNIAFMQIPSPQIKNLPLGNSLAKISKNQIKFPDFPPVVNIYKLKPEQENFYEANRARTLASLLKLTSGETKTINNIMYFETMEKDRVLSFDKAQRLWNYRSSNTNLSKLSISQEDTLISSGISFLYQMEINNSDAFQKNVSTCYLTYLDNQGYYSNNSTNIINSAKLILNKEIDLIKPVQNDLPLLKAPIKRIDYLDGIVNMTIINQGKDIATDMIYFNYKVHDYENTVGIYPIITVSDAYDKIQNNQGFLYRLTEVGSNIFNNNPIPTINEFKINVENTKLIYIESFDSNNLEPWTKYLQPFFLFEGQAQSENNNLYSFSFIVPALNPANYSNL